ncbi:MAG TPA: class I tRNA ligase family protein, partial [Methylomirabilota bacterium]|nr:class I tRNA ligase family protein [Methylomirabilota bacterium]
GADILRLWVVSQEYQADVRMSERVMNQLSEAYRKIRNTFRFGLSNLYDFDPARDAVRNEQLEELDRWMLQRTADLAQKCLDWYAAYDFHRVYHAIHDYCVTDLSAFYYDVLKDRLYTRAARNPARRSAQTAVYEITSALVRLTAPILVFTAEEAWKYLPKKSGEPASVHVAMFPTKAGLQQDLDEQTGRNWEWLFREARSVVLAALEQARNSKKISGALEAKVAINGETPEAREILSRHAADLRYLFIVSGAALSKDGLADAFRLDGVKGLSVRVDRADGRKCERCWNYSPRVGENARYPTVCERCSEALAEIEQAAAH